MKESAMATTVEITPPVKQVDRTALPKSAQKGVSPKTSQKKKGRNKRNVEYDEDEEEKLTGKQVNIPLQSWTI